MADIIHGQGRAGDVCHLQSNAHPLRHRLQDGEQGPNDRASPTSPFAVTSPGAAGATADLAATAMVTAGGQQPATPGVGDNCLALSLSWSCESLSQSTTSSGHDLLLSPTSSTVSTSTLALNSSSTSYHSTASPSSSIGLSSSVTYGPTGHGHGHQSHRTKRMRTSFKHHQLRQMKQYFNINHNPDSKDLRCLSTKTGLSKRVLQVRDRVHCNNYRPCSGNQSKDSRADCLTSKTFVD